MAQVATLVPKWRRIDVQGSPPKARHGHRAITIRDMMIIFGGGSEGIIDTLHVFRSCKFSCLNCVIFSYF